MSISDPAVLRWRRSSRSNGAGNECVEIALVGAAAAIRDSKNRFGGLLMIDEHGWEQLRSSVR
jgi:hypothetical protein